MRTGARPTASALALARNVSTRRFPHAEGAADLEELREEVSDILQGADWEQSWSVLDLDELSMVSLTHLVERGLMTPAFAEGSGSGRGFALYGDGLASLEINGTEHIRLLTFREGHHLPNLWSLLNKLDDRLETSIPYAFDPRWGYLSSQPRRAGSGMRVYVTLSVPALMLTGRLAGTAVELMGHGLALAPLWGGAGGMVQVSNVGLQRNPEGETLQQIEDVCKGIVEKERSVRKMFFRENPIQTRDHIGRALGVSKHSWSVSFGEAVNLLSAIQVGMELGLVDVPGVREESIFGLMTGLQPAHVVVEYMDAKPGLLEGPEIDQTRARLLRETFAGGTVR